jgi:CRISPR-associated exonuclease Cas4
MYLEEDFIQLSSIQHYSFCERQFYLAYVEEIWLENYLTASGRLLHQHVDEVHKEKRKNIIQEFGLSLCSYTLGISGKADVVEFHYLNDVTLEKIVPIEYKRGAKKENECDALQLCAQAICLEEMTGFAISHGFLFYGKERRRTDIVFSPELRSSTEKKFLDIHKIYNDQSEAPKGKYTSKCKSCSFYEYCKPKTIGNGKSAIRYVKKSLSEAGEI